MILAAGETIIDLITNQKTQEMTAHLGGSPYNVALTLGKLGSAVGFSTVLSNDTNGEQFKNSLKKNNVDDYSISTEKPSSIAWAFKKKDKNVDYSFYLPHTCISDYELLIKNNLTKQLNCFFYGSILSYWKERGKDIGEILYKGVARLKKINPKVMIAYDPNVRLGPIAGKEYCFKIMRKHLGIADIIKMSDEDFNEIFTKQKNQHEKIATHYLQRKNTKLFVITLAEKGFIAFYRSHEDGKIAQIKAKAPKTKLQDTVGAGDTFTGTLLNGLMTALKVESIIKSERRELKELTGKELSTILKRASIAAAINCERTGFNPPGVKELNTALKRRG